MFSVQCRQLVVITVVLIGDVSPRYIVDRYVKSHSGPSIVPWLGMLIHKPNENSKQVMSGIILVANRTAIAVARDVAKINKRTIRQTTHAMFRTPQNEPWYCDVVNYILHPEFNEDTLNTLALLQLEYNDDDFIDRRSLNWPTGSPSYSDKFAIGFTEQKGRLEQVVYRMQYVNQTDCINFYVHEQLDTRWMRPTFFRCFKGMFNKEPCVFDPGMALAVNASGQWTLLGISTWGPGCALPARFITFANFIPWVASKLRSTRRYGDHGPFSESINLEKDDYIYRLENITKNTIVLRPLKDYLEERSGTCGLKYQRDEHLIYREKGTYQVPGDAIGIYTLSHFNLAYHYNWRCIIINTTSNIYYKSKTEIWHSFGFGKGLGDEQRVRDYIRIYEIKRIPPEDPKPKKLFLTDHWDNYDHIDIRNLHFRFEFYKEVKIEILFYGPRKQVSEEDVEVKTRKYKWVNLTMIRRPHKHDLYTEYTTQTKPDYTTRGTPDKNRIYGPRPE